MNFLLKKIKKFLSASLVVSSVCLSPVNQVSARLEGRVATAEDFEKLTSELEEIFKKCAESKDKNLPIECDEKFMNNLTMKGLADCFYKTISEGKLTGNESTDSLAFSCAVLRILENMGIQSGLVAFKNSKNMGNYGDFDKYVVIYPLKGKSEKDCFVVIDPSKAFDCLLLRKQAKNRILKEVFEGKYNNDKREGMITAIAMPMLSFMLDLTDETDPWESFCCLDMNRYFEINAEHGWNIAKPGLKSSTLVIDFDSCELAEKFLESKTEDKRADYYMPLFNWLEKA